MRADDIIIKKRNKQELTRQEIDYFIKGYTSGDIPDYQAAAWAMAVLLNGMSARETTDLTLAMTESGEILNLSQVVPIAVDKHSTGGVGDKTTLVVEPIVAACGLPVGKMSGRGLGFTGGTLDKMESIPGFRANLYTQEFLDQLSRVGLVLSGQTACLAPADGKLYALRDVTGTVESIPLIASSIMCKKIAAGAQAIVMDVKWGEGAFMETLEEARKLGEMMVAIAKLAGREAVALLSDMNQPLGQMVGNALEVREAIESLQGGGPQDLREHCLTVAAHMLVLGKMVETEDQARQMAGAAIQDGSAWQRFRSLVKAQGGDVSYVDDPQRLPQAKHIETVAAPKSAYIKRINARVVGETAVLMGGGRAKKDDKIDYSVGIQVLHKIGSYVEQGAALFSVHAASQESLAQAKEQLLGAYSWSDQKVEPLPLFYGVIR
ncbi:MAG: thymidine phosphorylase [Anaerolineales bacterium]|jgi:pyrimidine-nucleoside phosphorylase